ncbi:hypothetical protein ACQFN5_17620 [Klebsiella sp. WOUb02]|uniref:hypothetical protein n=1 Tax=Klebsiella sp. WOUb02 TaxID=3161071 RepID=UPI003CE942E5
MPKRMFSLLAKTWTLAALDYPPIADETIDISLYYNKLSAREPLLNEVIEAVRQAF